MECHQWGKDPQQRPNEIAAARALLSGGTQRPLPNKLPCPQNVHLKRTQSPEPQARVPENHIPLSFLFLLLWLRAFRRAITLSAQPSLGGTRQLPPPMRAEVFLDERGSAARTPSPPESALGPEGAPATAQMPAGSLVATWLGISRTWNTHTAVK